MAEGRCYGMDLCGYCYDQAISKKPTFEYERYNLIVIGIILPLVGTFGLLGNAISAFIYSRKSMLSSLNVYLCALAASDTTIILTAFFLFFLESMRKRSLIFSKIYATLAPVTFPLGSTAQSLSVFLTVTAAVDCFILVTMSPSSKKRFCSVSRSLQVLAFIVTLAVLYNSPHMFEIRVIDCWSLQFWEESVDVCPTDLRVNETYFKIYYAWMYSIVMAVGPVTLLIILNTTIVITVRGSQPQLDGDSDVITLVLVVCLFVSCNVLPLTVNFLELLLSIENSYLIDLSNLMVVVNSSCNFLIYYAFGSRFRRTLQEYISSIFIKAPMTVATTLNNGKQQVNLLSVHKECLI